MNIILIGFMGTGKTTVGKALAERLGWDFIDLDDRIEMSAGKKITAIFHDDGETVFRSLEHDVVRQTIDWDKKVIAPGGGAVMRPDNLECLQKAGCLICLTADADTIFKRTCHNQDRPLLNVPDPVSAIKELLEQRKPVYMKAAHTIDTSSLSIEMIVDRIMDIVQPSLI